MDRTNAPKTDRDVAAIYERYSATVWRVCYAYMKNDADTEDAVQDTFLQLVRKQPVFSDKEHEKAWLIRTASNICINSLKHWRRKVESIDDHTDISASDGSSAGDIMRAVLALPDRYKAAVYLYYYEGYNTNETARILKKPPSTVRNHLREARGLLRKTITDIL